MALDTSIYGQYLRPVKSVADYDQEFMAQQQNALALGNSRQVNALNAMKFGEAQRQAQEAEVVRNALAQLPQGADSAARIAAYEGTRTPTGFSQADAMRKTMREEEAKRAEIAEREAKTQGEKIANARKVLEYAIQGLQVVPDPQSAAQYIQQGVSQGAWGMQQAQQMIATIPQDPAQFAQWRATQLRQTLAAKDQLPTVQTRNTGGSTDTLAIDPVTAQVTVANSVKNTMSPESAASNSRQWAEFNYRKGRDAAADRERMAAGGAGGAGGAAPVKLSAAQEREEADKRKAGRQGEQMLAAIGQARELLAKNPTASGVGSLIDAAGRQIGVSSNSAQVAAQLETLSGWMVANVPRMEGPQSNFDVENYKTMAAKVGDRSTPIAERLAALGTLENLHRKYAEINGTPLPEAPKAAGGAYSDAEKERRYQEWKRQQGAK